MKIKLWLKSIASWYESNQRIKRKELTQIISEISFELKDIRHYAIKDINRKLSIEKARITKQNNSIENIKNDAKSLLARHESLVTQNRILFDNNDISIKKCIDRFKNNELKFDEINQEIDLIKGTLVTAVRFEENMEYLHKIQKKIKKESQVLNKEVQEHLITMRVINEQFKNAMAIQCKDMIRKVNEKLAEK